MENKNERREEGAAVEEDEAADCGVTSLFLRQFIRSIGSESIQLIGNTRRRMGWGQGGGMRIAGRKVDDKSYASAFIACSFSFRHIRPRCTNPWRRLYRPAGTSLHRQHCDEEQRWHV